MVKDERYDNAIEIADRVWWVGHVLENDPFQCHVYLIENGKESILIDPGSKLTWPHTRRKILDLMPLENIKYIICHHQDPDIVSCIEDMLNEIGRENRRVVTHWRAAELLEHYDWGVEFYEVQENGWILECGERIIDFTFTPYMHFPGAFCSYDRSTGTLFSSDIFGAITKEFSLYAKDADEYFEMMKPFHTHYMPASEIVNYGLDNIQKCHPVEMIAPQHGSIIKKEFIDTIIKKLRKLKCGLYLEFAGTRDVELMLKVNAILPKIYKEASFFDSFYSGSKQIISLINRVYSVKRFFILAQTDKKEYIQLDSNKTRIELHEKTKDDIEIVFRDIFIERRYFFIDSYMKKFLNIDNNLSVFAFPLTDHDNDITGIGFFIFEGFIEESPETIEVLQKFEVAISVIARHEIEVYKIESERQKAYTMAVTDNLTGLYNRYYFDEVARQEIENARQKKYTVSLLYIDIDHFKKINDTYGHDTGDVVLKHFASILRKSTRENDMVFRLGGEEFVMIIPHSGREEAFSAAKRLKANTENNCIVVNNSNICCKFSGGISDTEEEGYSIDALLKSADMKLYKAKLSGRNRIIF